MFNNDFGGFSNLSTRTCQRCKRSKSVLDFTGESTVCDTCLSVSRVYVNPNTVPLYKVPDMVPTLTTLIKAKPETQYVTCPCCKTPQPLSEFGCRTNIDWSLEIRGGFRHQYTDGPIHAPMCRQCWLDATPYFKH